MRAGHAFETLVVPDGAAMGGYADRTGGVIDTRDPLEVHVVWLDDGTYAAALVVADVVCVNTDLVAAVRTRLVRLGADEVLVAATHTHSGPETGCLPGGAPTPQQWLTAIPAAAESAAIRARAGLTRTPLDAALHRTLMAGVGGVRADSSRPAVVPVDTLALRDAERIVGLITVVPVHPTVLSADNRSVSADLTGSVRRPLASRMPGAWVVVATGAAGDISTRNTRHAQTADECDRLGALVAEEIVDATNGPGVCAWRAGDRMTWDHADVVLAPGPTVAGVPDHAGSGTSDSRNDQTFRQGLRLAAERAGRPGQDVRVRVVVLRLGDLSVAGIPGEPYLALGERFVDAVDGPAMVLGYVDGYVGYLPTRAAYRQPTYEVLVSPVAAGSGEAVVDAAAALARRLADGAGTAPLAPRTWPADAVEPTAC